MIAGEYLTQRPFQAVYAGMSCNGASHARLKVNSKQCPCQSSPSWPLQWKTASEAGPALGTKGSEWGRLASCTILSDPDKNRKHAMAKRLCQPLNREMIHVGAGDSPGDGFGDR